MCAILTNDSALAVCEKHLTKIAKLPHSWQYVRDKICYDYRPAKMYAVLGCAQLEKMLAFVAANRALFRRYEATFTSEYGIYMMTKPADCLSNYRLQGLDLDQGQIEKHDVNFKVSIEAGYISRQAGHLMHKLEPNRHCPRTNLGFAESLAAWLINIPSSTKLVEQVGGVWISF